MQKNQPQQNNIQADDRNPNPGPTVLDPHQRILAVALELAKNASNSDTLEQLQFILVNDSRALINFDRCYLVSHLQSKSAVVAINNQPGVENKSGFIASANTLASYLKKLTQPAVLVEPFPKSDQIDDIVIEQIKINHEVAGFSSILIIPLVRFEQTIAHLVFEFFGSGPSEVETLTFLNMVPFLSSALLEKWMLDKDPKIRKIVGLEEPMTRIAGINLDRYRVAFIVVTVLVLIALLAAPVTLRIGGSTEVAPDYEYQAFAEIEGIIDKVLVREGDFVKKGQVLAALETKEIDFKLREAKRLLDSYKAEYEILRNQAAENQQKLAESQLVLIKSRRALHTIDFLEWQKQFLEIKAPIDGIILTRKIESLIGKKFKAGEPLCKIAPKDALVAEIFIRESDVSYIKKNQGGEVFLNYDPRRAYHVTIDEIPPIAEVVEREGNVYRVRAKFSHPSSVLKPGMKGLAQVNVSYSSLWFALTRRIRTKINQWTLYM